MVQLEPTNSVHPKAFPRRARCEVSRTSPAIALPRWPWTQCGFKQAIRAGDTCTVWTGLIEGSGT